MPRKRHPILKLVSSQTVMPTSTIILAAGYGTRLQNDLHHHPQLQYLAKTPKPLLPLSGRPILSHWIDHLTHPSIISTTLITNSLHEQYYNDWRTTHPDDSISIIANGTTSNCERHGAVTDLHTAISRIDDVDVLLVIAGDTLIPGTDINKIIGDFINQDAPAGVLAYKLSDIRDTIRRGMLAIEKRNNNTYATRLVEKPKPENAPSNLATAPIYLLRGTAITSIKDFLEDTKQLPLEKRDAPGHWLSYLLNRMECLVYEVKSRIDIGGLEHYRTALWDLSKGVRSSDEPAVGRAFPRVGFLGNPSDGYGGRVIALTVRSEGFAEVVATTSNKFRVLPNPVLEIGTEWDSVDELLAEVHGRGLEFGGRKLILAAVTVFARMYEKVGKKLPNCELSYFTTIPPRIGLAGSSALILATFRALSQFCSMTLYDICQDVTIWPELMKKAETEYLGIACGLMDRVVQVVQGVICMDFSGEQWKWERLKEELPDMCLAYSLDGSGECSGKVHGGLTKRFLEGDQVVKEVTESLCAIVEEGRDMFTRGVWDDLPGLFKRNFELRCRLVGVESVGKENIRLVDVANNAGFAAKMTGSGGCALCIPNPVRKLSDAEVDSAKRQFEEAGFVLRKVQVLKGLSWGKLRKA